MNSHLLRAFQTGVQRGAVVELSCSPPVLVNRIVIADEYREGGRTSPSPNRMKDH